MSNRIDKVNSEILKQASYIINYELKDPRINGLISIIKVSTTPDLKQCKIFVSTMSKKPDEVLKALKSAKGFIRNELKTKMSVRLMPELFFVLDNSIEYGIKIDRLLKEIHQDE